MITQLPDLSLGPARLAEGIAGMRAALGQAPKWRYCEKYVDRGQSIDPFYVLDIVAFEHAPGALTPDEPLFRTRIPGLRFKQLTRANDQSGQYWQAIDSAGLGDRLDHFLAMYRANELQPPGSLGRRAHEVFAMRRFVYRLRMPGREFVGFGPAAFAGLAGAMRGRVLVAGLPAVGLTLELTLITGAVQRRTTDAEGKFWFSRVPAGSHRLAIVGHELTSTNTSEAFGRVQGRVEAEGKPVVDVRVELETIDGEVFDTTTSARGSFDTGLVPAGGHTLRVPDFAFGATVTGEPKHG